MLEYYATIVTVTGWVLIFGAIAIAVSPAQFLLKGSSSLGEDSVLHYFMAYSSAVQLAWGAALVIAAGAEQWAHAIALPSALGFALMSLWRIPLGRNAEVLERLGKAPRVESVVFALASAFFLYACQA
jgi:hypothetical protein